MSPRVGIVFDLKCGLHRTGPGHPERPERLDAVRSALEWSGALGAGVRIPAMPVERAVAERLHNRDYLARVQHACESGAAFVDTPDSAICPESWEIAELAAGGVVAAARAIGAGDVERAFCAVRPPGHHAERDRSMGFCFLNNVALAAEVLRREYGLSRILIVDWDVHHGNGTQHLFEDDPGVLFVSLHGHPDYLYPGTGFEHERGRGAGAGFTVNLPFRPGATDADYRDAFRRCVLPETDRFRPEALIISAGFDAHRRDPIGCASLSEDGFVWMLQELIEAAERHCAGRLLSVLEGGYDLDALRRCVQEHVERLMQR